MSDPHAEAKRRAGEAAVDRFVRDGMCIGLGTGTTAYWAVQRVGRRIAEGETISAVTTSLGTEALCRELDIPVVPLLSAPVAVAIDGADEVAPDFALTKGGGGALFREKIVALAAEQFVVIVDASKLVPHLGAFPTPVEVVPFALAWVRSRLAAAYRGVEARERTAGDAPFRTDNGNAILDCAFGAISDPAALDVALRTIAGVVSTGLFYDVADTVLVADDAGVRDLARTPPLPVLTPRRAP
jgi:ribose 5-phosphate isomerase A